MVFTIYTIALIIAVIVYLWFRRPDPRFPPCPTRPWPIVGHLFTLKDDPRPQFEKWRNQVGDIFSLYMGETLVAVLSGYNLFKEAFVKRGNEFIDRPRLFIDQATGLPGRGVIMTSGAVWKEQRGFMVSCLRKFGMGTNVFAQNIQKEVSFYLDFLAKLKGEATDLRVLTDISMANVICPIIIGERYEYDDEKL